MHMASPWQILLIALVVLVLFGRGKVSAMMGEFGKGITAFKKGISESSAIDKDETVAAAAPAAPRDVTPAEQEKV